MIGLGAGRVFHHLTGPAALFSVAIAPYDVIQHRVKLAAHWNLTWTKDADNLIGFALPNRDPI
jgi:hypothetical protein